MRHDPAFARFAVAAMHAAIIPNGGYFITRQGVRAQLSEALDWIGRPAHWTAAQIGLVDACAEFLNTGLPPAIAQVQAVLAQPWPSLPVAAGWTARADIGDRAEDEAA